MPTHPNRSLTALLLTGALAFSVSAVYAEEFTSKDLAVVQRPMADVAPPPPRSHSNGLQVSAWVNHPNNTYAFGEKLVLSVKTNRDAYLTIVDVGTSGRVHIIFPNRYQTHNFIRAGEVLQVPGSHAPFDFQVSGPAGTELIKVIASPSSAPLFRASDTKPAGPFKSLNASAPAVAKDLNVVLREPRHRDGDSYNKIIRIVPR